MTTVSFVIKDELKDRFNAYLESIEPESDGYTPSKGRIMRTALRKFLETEGF